MKFVTSGCWSHDPRYHIYHQVQDQVSISNDLLLKHNCIVISSALQQVLQLTHSQHQGISKTKALLHEKVWWPSINRDVEQLIKSRHACQITTASKYKCQPLKMSDPEVCIAHCCCRYTGTLPCRRIIVLLLIDYRSYYHVIAIMKTVTSQTVLNSLTKTFSMFGYPHRVASDNGPQFISEEFSEYMQQHDIGHR